MAPCKITQDYDQDTVELDFWIPSVLSVYIEHIAIKSVQKQIDQHWILCFKKNLTIMVMAVKWMDKRTYASLKHLVIVTTMYWI